MHAHDRFHYTITGAGDMIVVELAGDLDGCGRDDLQSAIRQLCAGQGRRVVLEMSGVSSVDSRGLGALLNVQKVLTDAGRSLFLVGCREPVRHALTLTRLEVLFRCYPSIASIPPSA